MENPLLFEITRPSSENGPNKDTARYANLDSMGSNQGPIKLITRGPQKSIHTRPMHNCPNDAIRLSLRIRNKRPRHVIAIARDMDDG